MKITIGRPLLVLAVKEEAQFLDTDLPVLLTGMGKVNAATALATVLARGPRPSGIVNLGTAGALRPGWTGTHVIGSVIQHDLDNAVLASLTGEVYGAPIDLPDHGGPVLATGDSFISDEAARARLAAHARSSTWRATLSRPPPSRPVFRCASSSTSATRRATARPGRGARRSPTARASSPTGPRETSPYAPDPRLPRQAAGPAMR